MFCNSFGKTSEAEHQSESKKIENYTILLDKKIGEGNFSTVYEGVDTNTGKRVAIKIIKYSSLTSKVSQQLLKNEVEILKELNHPNVIKCFDIFTSKNHCYIITELYQSGDLEKILFRKKNFSEKQISSFVSKIYQGLLYLSQKGIVHRDFKLANIFIGPKDIPVIADFGFAIKSKQSFKDINIGSPIYMSPQGMLLHEYGPKTEVWAFGVMIYELLHGNTHLCHCRSQRQLRQQIMLPPRIREDISLQCRNFIDLCLKVDPKHRTNMKDLIMTPYLMRIMEEQKAQIKNIPNLLPPQKKNYKHDLFSTSHSNTITLNQSPVLPISLAQQLTKMVKTYEEGVSLLHYCRLIHKTIKKLSSNILRNHLLLLCSELQNICIHGGDSNRNQKLFSTIKDYVQKYRKEHKFSGQFCQNISFSEVLQEIETMSARASEIQSRPFQKGFNFSEQYYDNMKMASQYLSCLSKESQILKKSMECQFPKLCHYTKFSQAEKFLESVKGEEGKSLYPNFPK